MFRVAPSAMAVACTYDWRFGWSARVSVPGPDGQEWLSETYGPLSPAELVDAVAAALETALAGPQRQH
jgi:hypothetical protein